jgi:hypothetical protein
MDGGPAEFEEVARRLRAMATTCAPPVGVGSFDVLYVNERELVVWYSPSREHQRPGEVAIACSALRLAWEALLERGALDEAALLAIGQTNWTTRWLLAILAQLPGVSCVAEPLTLRWSAANLEMVIVAASDPQEAPPPQPRGKKTRPRKARDTSRMV